MTTKTSKSSKSSKGDKGDKGDQRGQSAFTRTGGKSAGKAVAAAKAKKAGRRGRRPGAFKAGRDRNWGVIATFVAVGVIAAGIIGYAFWAQRGDARLGWEEEAAAIEGIVNYRETNPEMLTEGHRTGPQQYEVLPPVGGDHQFVWQNCQGNIYAEPIHNEHAVHSLEHGTVWITYNPDQLSADQVSQLASLVEGNEKMMLSPFPGLDSPISLQAWGYQLKVTDPGDPRISEFVRALRVNASLEGAGARCDSGVTTGASDPSTLNLQ